MSQEDNEKMKTTTLTLIPVLAFLGILGIVILFGNWSQPQPELGGGAIDMDPDLSPSFAYDFAFGFLYNVIVPLASLAFGISALFLVPHFILKRKKIPSRPYLVVILSGLLLFFGIPSFVASLQTFAIILSQPEQIRTWIFDSRFIFLLMPIIASTIAGISLYRSSVIRKLIRK